MAWTAAGAAEEVNFNIPAQDGATALQQFSEQSGVQVVYVFDELTEVRTRAVIGAYLPRVALASLLEGSGYEITQTRGDDFVIGRIRQATTGSVSGVLRKSDTSSASGIQVQVGGSQRSALTNRDGEFIIAGLARGRFTLVVTADGYQPMHITDVVVRAGREVVLGQETLRPADTVSEMQPFMVRGRMDEVLELDRYVVEGLRAKPFVAGNMDIPRTMNDVQPYYVFDADTIDVSGAVNVEDFLRQRVTMNTVVQAFGQDSASNHGNISTVNLRGLGEDKTLVLVNGRRMAGVSEFNTAAVQPDLNGIPLSAIDRIEVMPTSASGIYGGSAVGGVVNVILKRDYNGGEIRLNYENTWDSDTPRRSASLTYGFALEGGRTRVMLNAALSDSKPLLFQDRREIYDEYRARIESNYPTFFNSLTYPPVGGLPNIAPRSTAVDSLTLKDGTSLGSRNTFISAGMSPDASPEELAADLLANAGTWNFDLPPTIQPNTGLLRPFGSTPKNESLRLSVQREMTDRLEMYAEFGHADNSTTSVMTPFTNGFNIPASAPGNPFLEDVTIRFPTTLAMPINTSSQTRSASIGALLNLPAEWVVSLDYTWSQNIYTYFNSSSDFTAMNAALANGEMSPFFDTLAFPVGLEDYASTVTFYGDSRLNNVALRGSGLLPALPWGNPRITVGLEHRRANTPDRWQRTERPITVESSYNFVFFPRSSTTDSFYAEASVPLVQEDRFPAVHSFELQASGRIESNEIDNGTQAEYIYYNQDPAPPRSFSGRTIDGEPIIEKASYSSENFTYGLKYQPIEDITLRISQATAFLPPTPAQLVPIPNPNPSMTNVIDPVSGNTVSVQRITGGNPDLTPQNSESFNGGIIWEPHWEALRGLRLNVEYYRIQQFDAISTLAPQSIVDQEQFYPERVIRDETGRITTVDTSYMNLYRRETEGWDFNVLYNHKTSMGTFSLQAAHSLILGLRNQIRQDGEETDGVGSPLESGAASYKTNATLSWAHRGWSAGWTTTYFPSYKQYGAAGGPISVQVFDGAPYPNNYLRGQGSDVISSQIYHDFYVGYDFGNQPWSESPSDSKFRAAGKRLLDGLSLQFGMRNVFDAVPPLDAYHSANFYMSTYGNAQLRRYWLSVKKEF
ncbi:TonB-dependent receptor domain-containing protein [Actomonas aquatica]|uniref:TonB-dependent receptor n=1 Tax=Actomonas aquatica TaxID=2866162 RepID=A0ABZ1C2U8_9BACT|nr:TonB-dependent receptor [Opitutus sp. WL0086]WRQ85771.1 TonB-dependent receptor [Opitutus sp. WL0086]